MTFLQGKKTYIVCALTIIFALLGGFLGFYPWPTVLQMILAALAAAGFRSAITKLQ